LGLEKGGGMTGDDFFELVKQIVIDAGMIVQDRIAPFNGAIKQIKKPKHFATYTRDGQHVLIKTIHQSVSGSASDKVVAFYVNMAEAPFDKVIIVLNDRLNDSFAPYLQYFQRRHWTLDDVLVMNVEQFRRYINNTITEG
jgi:hypothetical protein